MPTSEETLRKILANAKSVPQLPEAFSFEGDDYIPVFNVTTGKLVKIKKSNIVFTGEPITEIVGLTDTPSSRLGQKGKILVVSEDETKFEYKVLAEVTGVTQAQLDAKVEDIITDGVLDKAPSQNAVFDALATKQATLVSGTNIRTVNGESLLGSTDLAIAGASRTIKPLPNTTQYTLIAADFTDFILEFTANANEEISVILNAGVAPLNGELQMISTGNNKLVPSLTGVTATYPEQTNPKTILKGWLGGIVTATDTISFNGSLESTATTVIKEHQINGTRITASVSGTYALDWNAASVFDLTMTANTTFSSVNLPTGTNTKIIEVLLTGAFVPTFPATWVKMPGSIDYAGAKINRYQVDCINGTGGSEKIYYDNRTTT